MFVEVAVDDALRDTCRFSYLGDLQLALPVEGISGRRQQPRLGGASFAVRVGLAAGPIRSDAPMPGRSCRHVRDDHVLQDWVAASCRLGCSRRMVHRARSRRRTPAILGDVDESSSVRCVAHEAVEDRAQPLRRGQPHVVVGLVDDQLHRGEL